MMRQVNQKIISSQLHVRKTASSALQNASQALALLHAALVSVNHTNSEKEESEMKTAFPDLVESKLFTYNKPDNSGYLEYSSSDQYITAQQSYLPNPSWEPAEKNKV